MDHYTIDNNVWGKCAQLEEHLFEHLWFTRWHQHIFDMVG
jgi:hypothetical protein